MIITGPKYVTKTTHNFCLVINNSLSPHVRNLWVIFYNNLSSEHHINLIIRTVSQWIRFKAPTYLTNLLHHHSLPQPPFLWCQPLVSTIQNQALVLGWQGSMHLSKLTFIELLLMCDLCAFSLFFFFFFSLFLSPLSFKHQSWEMAAHLEPSSAWGFFPLKRSFSLLLLQSTCLDLLYVKSVEISFVMIWCNINKNWLTSQSHVLPCACSRFFVFFRVVWSF